MKNKHKDIAITIITCTTIIIAALILRSTLVTMTEKITHSYERVEKGRYMYDFAARTGQGCKMYGDLTVECEK